jgi:uncharacterized membrane protein
MATDYFSDAQSLTTTQEFAEIGDPDSDYADPRTSDALQDHRLAQFLGGLSIGLGLAQLLAPRAVGRAIGAGDHTALIRLLGVREITSGVGLLSRRQPGRWSWARVIGDAMDLALLGAAATSPRADRQRLAVATAAVAGVAALDAYATRRLHGVEVLQPAAVLVNQTITVNTDPQTVYDFWSNLENLPRFMRHLESVTRTDERVSHWVARAPAGTKVEWDSEIVADQPNRRIAWRTLPGSQVEHEGTVDFTPAPGGRGTHLRVTLRYVPPLGPIAVPIARLLGEEPRVQINEDLRRFKQLIETGEVATTTGQPAGRRSILGRTTLGRWLS